MLINESFNADIFPSIRKVARVIPISKFGWQNQVENFRPISTIHFLSKVIERLIYTRILAYINKFNILNDVQYGFRKGKSTGDGVLTFTHNCYEALKDKKYLVSVFLDFKKAFDAVDHGILLRKLHCYSFRGTANNSWFESYLENRFQYVDIHVTYSAKLLLDFSKVAFWALFCFFCILMIFTCVLIFLTLFILLRIVLFMPRH